MEQSVKAITNIPWPLFPSEDKIIWKGNVDGVFSVKSSFATLNTQNSNVQSKLWKMKLHERLKLFIWRILAGVLLSREAITDRIGHGENQCAICGAAMETYLHLFKECHGVRALAFASQWRFHLDYMEATNYQDLLKMCISPQGSLTTFGLENEFVSTFLSTLWYCI